MNQNEILNDWPLFLKHVVSLHELGKSEDEISESIGEVYVQWEGRVADIKLNEEYVPGIAITMNPESVPMKDGNNLRPNYQYLNIDSEKKSTWDQCRLGDYVQFKAKIRKQSEPFPAIQLSKTKEGREVLLMISLYDCELVNAA